MADAELVRYLTAAERVLVFTGAGISTACGIPDYRGPRGVWKTRTPVMLQEFLADEEARHRYWRMKSEDWEAFAGAEPSPAHLAIADLHRAGKLRQCVTQNIDGLHARAGLPSEALVELHGTNAEAECMTCARREPAAPHYAAYGGSGQLPLCPDCGGWLKPGVISFGQALRAPDLERAQAATMDCDLVVALGSTLSVYPAAAFPLAAAREGIPYIVVNLGPTEHDNHPLVSLRLEGDLQDIFAPAVADALAMSG